MPEVIAILCSDIHLSHRPPISRSVEPDWYEAMARPLRELEDLQTTDNGCVPVICGGDLFDRWNSPPELINFALDHLPEMYSIPGQHDLPYHGIEEIRKSAYWTMGSAKKVWSLRLGEVVELGDRLKIWGFPFGSKLQSCPPIRHVGVKLLVAHQYVWKKKQNYPMQTPLNYAPSMQQMLEGYDVALFGDNHKGFLHKTKKKTTIFNAGTFMRRTSAERNYKPMVGFLLEDGTVKEHFLDTSQDKFLSDSVLPFVEQTMLHLEGFLEGLKELGDSGLDFKRVLESTLVAYGASKAVRRVILEAMEEKK